MPNNRTREQLEEAKELLDLYEHGTLSEKVFWQHIRRLSDVALNKLDVAFINA